MVSPASTTYCPNTLPDARDVPLEGSSLCLGFWSSVQLRILESKTQSLDATPTAAAFHIFRQLQFSQLSLPTSNLQPRHAFFPDIQRRMRQPELFPVCFRALSCVSWACSRSLLSPAVSFVAVFFRAIWTEDGRLVVGHMIKESQFMCRNPWNHNAWHEFCDTETELSPNLCPENGWKCHGTRPRLVPENPSKPEYDGIYDRYPQIPTQQIHTFLGTPVLDI